MVPERVLFKIFVVALHISRAIRDECIYFLVLSFKITFVAFIVYVYKSIITSFSVWCAFRCYVVTSVFFFFLSFFSSSHFIASSSHHHRLISQLNSTQTQLLNSKCQNIYTQYEFSPWCVVCAGCGLISVYYINKQQIMVVTWSRYMSKLSTLILIFLIWWFIIKTKAPTTPCHFKIKPVFLLLLFLKVKRKERDNKFQIKNKLWNIKFIQLLFSFE